MDPQTQSTQGSSEMERPLRPLRRELNMRALLEDLERSHGSYLEQFLREAPLTIDPNIGPAPATYNSTQVASSAASAMELDICSSPAATVHTAAAIRAATSEHGARAVPGPSAPTDRPVVPKEAHVETSPASSDRDEFELVQSKSNKRKLKPSKSLANPPKKIGLAQPVNKTPAAHEEESEDSTMVEPPREKVPPLYIREKRQWERIVPLLDNLKIDFQHARSTAVGIRVQCPSSENHRRLTTLLRNEKVGYHTYALPDERVLRTVIRGLPRELSTELIRDDLVAQGLPVQQVHRMYHHRTKHPFDMVLVISDLTPEGKKINTIKSVCRLSGLSIEAPNNRGIIGQCHRCQLYGHSARNCHAHPRCVKCLGDHGTSECPRKQPTEEPPSCVLCRSKGHPANYRGCPKAPKEPKRRVKPAGRKPAAANKPAQKFVPAPAPAVNAWSKPLPRANNALVPTAAAAAAASPPVAAPTAAPAPRTTFPRPSAVPNVAPPKPAANSVPQSTAADRLSDNWAYVSYIIENVDIERLDAFVQQSKLNFTVALRDHADLLISINNVRKTLNG